MKVRLHKKSADGKICVELEDTVKKGEFGATALRRLEIEANCFLSARQDRLRFMKDSPRSKEPAEFLKTPSKLMGGGKKAASPAPQAEITRPLFSRNQMPTPIEDAIFRAPETVK